MLVIPRGLSAVLAADGACYTECVGWNRVDKHLRDVVVVTDKGLPTCNDGKWKYFNVS